MYNYKLKKVDPLSSFKFGIFFSITISVIAVILLFIYNFFSSIVIALGPELFINVFVQKFIRLFFTAILFGFASLVVSGLFTLAAYVFNLSIIWSEGLKVELETYVEEVEEEVGDQKRETNEESSAVME